MTAAGFTVDRNTEQWNSIWKGLSSLPINGGDTVCENEETGDCWQYMGSDNLGHHFRHRKHPGTMKRESHVVKLTG